MKTYTLRIPITGIAYKEVEAETEEDAIQQAFESLIIDDIQEWDATEKIVQGNVFYGMMNQMHVESEEIEPDEN